MPIALQKTGGQKKKKESHDNFNQFLKYGAGKSNLQQFIVLSRFLTHQRDS